MGKVGPLPMRYWMSKALVGYLNWRFRRSRHHSKRILQLLIEDLLKQNPDHVICSGDLCNLGLHDEWDQAQHFLETLGEPRRVSFIPGNHDAYLPHSLKGVLSKCKPWIGESSVPHDRNGFPSLRTIGKLSIFGINCAIPTRILSARGEVGSEQRAALCEAIERHKSEFPEQCIVLVTHYPILRTPLTYFRSLKDYPELIACVRRLPIDLVLFGHYHKNLTLRLKTGSGEVPMIGVSSASSCDRRAVRRAGYHLYCFEDIPGVGMQLASVEQRHLIEGDVFQTTTRIPLTVS